jgi:hypothetical protein
MEQVLQFLTLLGDFGKVQRNVGILSADAESMCLCEVCLDSIQQPRGYEQLRIERRKGLHNRQLDLLRGFVEGVQNVECHSHPLGELAEQREQLSHCWFCVFTEMLSVGLLDKILKFWVSLERLLDEDLENVPHCHFCLVAIAKVDIANTELEPQLVMQGLKMFDND